MKITEKYFITVDTYNLILNRKYTSEEKKGKDGKIIGGKETSEIVGYYNNMALLLERILKEEILMQTDIKENIEELIAEIKRIGTEIKEFSNNFTIQEAVAMLQAKKENNKNENEA